MQDLLSLVDDDGILEQIAAVDSGAAPLHFGVFLHQQPADVGEKEAATRVVRISVRLAELVVDSVVATPFVDIILN